MNYKNVCFIFLFVLLINNVSFAMEKTLKRNKKAENYDLILYMIDKKHLTSLDLIDQTIFHSLHKKDLNSLLQMTHDKIQQETNNQQLTQLQTSLTHIKNGLWSCGGQTPSTSSVVFVKPFPVAITPIDEKKSTIIKKEAEKMLTIVENKLITK